MLFAAVHESAIGTKRTYRVALHMSAIGGKADMARTSPDCFAIGRVIFVRWF
jgi:hypothetical protein